MRNPKHISSYLILLLFFIGSQASSQTIAKINGVKVKKIPQVNAFIFNTGLAVDADGSPRAYHPQNKGIDDLSNAGHHGNWWALATDQNGQPFIQTAQDPFPGYYISSTSLYNTKYAENDCRRYVNAEEIPYIVLPEKVIKKTGVVLGDIAIVYNKANEIISYAIFADVGPPGKLGEGSIALANNLKINSDARNGGIERDIIYILFPRSGNGETRSLEEINSIGKKLLQRINGLKGFK